LLRFRLKPGSVIGKIIGRAFEAFARSGVKRTLLESGHLLTNSITSSTRKSRAAGGSSSANS
ncbi:MAG: hypothetical protein WB691_29440, partial [Pseudolabrys sp.]